MAGPRGSSPRIRGPASAWAGMGVPSCPRRPLDLLELPGVLHAPALQLVERGDDPFDVHQLERVEQLVDQREKVVHWVSSPGWLPGRLPGLELGFESGRHSSSVSSDRTSTVPISAPDAIPESLICA